MLKKLPLLLIPFLSFSLNCQINIVEELQSIDVSTLSTVKIFVANEDPAPDSYNDTLGMTDPINVTFHYATEEACPRLMELVKKACDGLSVGDIPVLLAFDDSGKMDIKRFVSYMQPTFSTIFGNPWPIKVTIADVGMIKTNVVKDLLARLKGPTMTLWAVAMFNRSAIVLSEKFLTRSSEEEVYGEILHQLFEWNTKGSFLTPWLVGGTLLAATTTAMNVEKISAEDLRRGAACVVGSYVVSIFPALLYMQYTQKRLFDSYDQQAKADLLAYLKKYKPNKTSIIEQLESTCES